MDTKELISVLLIVLLVLLLACNARRKDGFSLSKKPMEEDNSLLHRNPFDDVDYQTPMYYKIYNK
jgi:hypothetical protein